MLRPLAKLDDSLLTAFVDSGFDIRVMAATTGHPLSTLIGWADSDAITPYLAALDRLRAIREYERQSQALTALSQALKESDNPIEVRRLATTILTASTRMLRAKFPLPMGEGREVGSQGKPSHPTPAKSPPSPHAAAPSFTNPTPREATRTQTDPRGSSITPAPITPLIPSTAIPPLPYTTALYDTLPARCGTPAPPNRRPSGVLAMAAGAPP